MGEGDSDSVVEALKALAAAEHALRTSLTDERERAKLRVKAAEDALRLARRNQEVARVASSSDTRRVKSLETSSPSASG